MVRYSCRESRRQSKKNSQKLSPQSIKASHDSVRGNYYWVGGAVMLLLPSIIHNVSPFYVSIGLTQGANRLVYRPNIE